MAGRGGRPRGLGAMAEEGEPADGSRRLVPAQVSAEGLVWRSCSHNTVCLQPPTPPLSGTHKRSAAAEQGHSRVCPALPQQRALIRNLPSQQVLVLRQPLAHLSGHERGACRNSGAATQNLAHQPSAAAVSTLRDHKNAEESPNQCKWLAKSVFQWPALTAKK